MMKTTDVPLVKEKEKCEDISGSKTEKGKDIESLKLSPPTIAPDIERIESLKLSPSIAPYVDIHPQESLKLSPSIAPYLDIHPQDEPPTADATSHQEEPSPASPSPASPGDSTWLEVMPLPNPIARRRQVTSSSAPGAHSVLGRDVSRLTVGMLSVAEDSDAADPTQTSHASETETATPHHQGGGAQGGDPTQGGDPHILGATLVEEDEESGQSPQPTTEVLDPKQVVPLEPAPRRHQGRTKGWILLVVGCLVLTGALAAILLTRSTNGNGGSLSSVTTSGSAAFHVYPPFRDDFTVATMNELESDPNSPVYKANRWVMEDPLRSSYTPHRQQQRFMMAWTYYVTNGHNWTRNDYWLSYNVSECEWYNNRDTKWVPDDMPICRYDDDSDDPKLLVLSLPHNNLRGNQLDGTIDFIFNDLVVLDVSYNYLSGNIPMVLTDQPLEVNVVSHNQFTGIVTTNGASLPKIHIRVYMVDGNKFSSYWSGTLFPFWETLEILNVTGNNYTGFLSPNIKYCKNLTYIGMGDNLFAKSLPSELGLLTKLQEIDISGNSGMVGTIPEEISNLPLLTRLDVTGTALTGSIPTEICDRLHDPDVLMEVNATCDVLQCCA